MIAQGFCDMKNEKKSKNNIKRKIAFVAGTALCLVGVGTFIVTQARRNTLNPVEEYSKKNTFKILEIVPSNVNDANEEIGYFVSADEYVGAGQGSKDFADVSKAKSLGGRSNGDSEEELQNFIDMRDYGLIKFEGIDRGSYNVDVSEHPVYSRDANFVRSALSGYKPMGNQFVLGSYKMSTDNSGSYFLQDGYVIKEDGKIYKEIKTEVQKPVETPEQPPEEVPTVSPNDGPTVSSNDGPTVSSNDVEEDTTSESGTENESGNTTVSANEPTYEITYEITYEPVAVGNRNNKALPEGIEQRVGADGKVLKTGDVEFTLNSDGIYYGLTENAYYYYAEPSINNDFRNGEWFKEYVLGDRTLTTKINIDTIAANDIKKESLVDDNGNPKYDLIYVSGSYEAYQGANVDLSEEVVMALFNLVTLPTGQDEGADNVDYEPNYQAVIMDYALLGPTSSANPSNIEKLALLLWQQDQRAILSMSTEGLSAQDTFTMDENSDLTSMPAGTSNTWTTLGATMNGMTGMVNGNFVAGSVYVYNHLRSYFTNSKVQIDAKDFFANGDFASTYTDAVVSSGFSAVKAAVQMNNINFSNKRVSEAITPALVVQYILSYDGTSPRMIKTDLRVLEIQPVKAFLYNEYWGTTPYSECKESIKENRDEFVKKYFDESFTAKPEAITFTSMTIEEFIGRNEDLNETYDMIYIGSNTYYEKDKSYYYMMKGTSVTYSVVNGKLEATQSNDVSISNFNDSNMYGMLYYNIGDLFDVGTRKDNTLDSLLGIIDDGSVYREYSDAKNPGKRYISHARFSGRDFTTDKKEKMIDFLEAGYPVIVAGDIMRSVPSGNSYIKTINPTEVTDTNISKRDHGRVDNSSELYEFLKYGVYGEITVDEDGKESYLGGLENLISEADVEIGLLTKEELATFFNKPKLSLSITNQPTAYGYTTKEVSGVDDVINEQTKLSADPLTGKYYLDYEFTITNAATIVTGNDTYGVHLYVDINADGKFSESEELGDCTITNAVNGAEVGFTTGLNGRIYSLNADVLYKLRREVPEGYSGVLPWCLEVAMDNNQGIRASQIGYTQIPRTGNKITINILQITKKNNNGTTLNLENQLADPEGSNNYFGLYLSQLKDYEVKVKTITQNEYEREYNEQRDEKYLDKYDMLILGFGDCYDAFETESAVNGIIKYMDSGKPVLLTHDLVMFRAGATQTKMLRNVVGMDRYGVYDYSVLDSSGKAALRQDVKYTIPADSVTVQKIEEAGHRVVYLPGSNKTTTDYQTHGISNLTMVRYRYNGNQYAANDKNRNEMRYINWKTVNELGKAAWDDQQRYEVHNINEGQITTYPYILPESFTVSQTHNQYYQLDMEADMDQDGETDIVVWYTLGQKAGQSKGYTGGGDEYNMTPNDVINNYYIYNRGNITYSGVGHSKPAASADDKYEAQLFVNTMIAAYRAGVRTPNVKVYESVGEESEPLNSLAVTYDRNVGKNAENGDAESSILRYEDGTYMNEFLDEGEQATKVYFQIDDPNFVKGNKKITAGFFLEDSIGDKEIVLGDGTKIKVSELPIKIYSADFSTQVAADELKSGVRYGFYLPLSYLKTQGELKLYISAKTKIENISVTNHIVTQESNVAYRDFTVVKMDLLNLD